MMTDELVAVSQDRESTDGMTTKTIVNYLNIIPSSNNCRLVEY